MPLHKLMPYTPIVATLGYVLSSDRSQVLLVHRNARADDQHLGKYNGLGGKMDADEDVVACMQREIREEAGIEAAQWREILRMDLSNSASDEHAILYVAQDLTFHAPQPDHACAGEHQPENRVLSRHRIAE